MLPPRLFIPLAVMTLVGAYLITVWTNGIATGVGFFVLIAAYMAVSFYLWRRKNG